MIAVERAAGPSAGERALPRAEVHVWWLSLDATRPDIDRLAGLLSKDERARAAQYCFERDRHRFVVGRGLLRTILGRYLGTDPARLAFDYGPHGKPALAGQAHDDGLRFNLAHSQGVGVLAVARREVGIDVECRRPVPDAEQIAKTNFSALEHATFCALPPRLRTRAFFDCWTRKEAFVKAIGDGLTHPLDTFEVSFAPGAPAQLASVLGEPDAARRWLLVALECPPGCTAALVAEGRDWRLIASSDRFNGVRRAGADGLTR